MKVALAGIGKIAVDQHIPALRNSGDWELAATVSRHGVVAGVEGFTDMRTMLEARPDIGMVSLCMPPAPRFAHAAAALAAGRHVMLEKPPGATLSECHELERLARQAGVTIFATWHSREAAEVDAARDWLAGKRLRRLAVTWKEDVHRWHPGQDWIWEAGGLGVFDPGINALSIVTKILADPIHVDRAELTFPENRQTPIAADLHFFHPGGAEVSAVFDWRQKGDQIWTIEVETDEGSMVLVDGGARLVIDGREAGPAGDAPLGGEYPRLYTRMATLVRAGTSDMDLAPMRHVADAFTLGRRVTGERFSW
jgi:D-galactose 1-dehydrogenase